MCVYMHIVCMRVYACECVGMHLSVCEHECVRMCGHTCDYVGGCVDLHGSVWECFNACVCMHVNIWACI